MSFTRWWGSKPNVLSPANCFLILCSLFLHTQICLFPAIAEPSDPLESVNRPIFWVNDQIDIYFLEPVATGYDKALPKPVKLGIKNFFINLGSPVYIVSDLVQLKFSQAGDHTLRFLLNTLVGAGGLLDVGKDLGIPHHTEDFGSALGYHGTPAGAYLVLPLLGPSNLRDLFGRIVDGFLNPAYYTSSAWGDGEFVSYGLTAVDVVDTRARLLDAIESGKEASMDYYSFVRNTYHQVRQNVIYDDNPPEETDPAEFD